MSRRWSVCKRGGYWRIYDGDAWHDKAATLTEAHTLATQYAAATQVFQPGSLTTLRELVEAHRWLTT